MKRNVFIIIWLNLFIIICQIYSDEDKIAIFIESVFNNDVDKVKELLENGFDPNSRIFQTKEIFSILSYSIMHNKPEISKLLLLYNADPEGIYTEDSSPLEYAIRLNKEFIKFN